MSQTTIDHLAHTIANPPEGNALPDLVKTMHTRREYLRNITRLHTTALHRERVRFDTANTATSPFSMDRPHCLRAIDTYEKTLVLHAQMAKTLHENWVEFHHLMQEGTALLFTRQKMVEGGVVPGVEEGLQYAQDAKTCLDLIEWALFEWRMGVVSAMKGISLQMASEWRNALALRYPEMVGERKPAVEGMDEGVAVHGSENYAERGGGRGIERVA
jgi:hypothetical protein